MSAPNRLARSIAPFDRLPEPLRRPARNLALGRFVRFVGTAGLDFEVLTPTRVVVSVKNRGRVQNHIGTVHAAAMALVAETATGFVVGLNLADEKVPVIKSMHIDFRRRAKGGLRAEAVLDAEQLAAMAEQPKGEVDVKVTVTDESGAEPIEARMIWAWTPKR